MYKYNYKEEIKNDISFYFSDNNMRFTDYTDPSTIVDELWVVDEITGNGPYGYADDEDCAQFLTCNLNLAFEALEEFGGLRDRHKHIPHIEKYLDTTIRCYLLPQCVDELWEEANENH